MKHEEYKALYEKCEEQHGYKGDSMLDLILETTRRVVDREAPTCASVEPDDDIAHVKLHQAMMNDDANRELKALRNLILVAKCRKLTLTEANGLLGTLRAGELKEGFVEACEGLLL